jgi:hypothetical protein
MLNLPSEVVAGFAVVNFVLAVGLAVWGFLWGRKVKKALGARKDWKRRFDRMREMLHL